MFHHTSFLNRVARTPMMIGTLRTNVPTENRRQILHLKSSQGDEELIILSEGHGVDIHVCCIKCDSRMKGRLPDLKTMDNSVCHGCTGRDLSLTPMTQGLLEGTMCYRECVTRSMCAFLNSYMTHADVTPLRPFEAGPKEDWSTVNGKGKLRRNTGKRHYTLLTFILTLRRNIQ